MDVKERMDELNVDIRDRQEKESGGPGESVFARRTAASIDGNFIRKEKGYIERKRGGRSKKRSV
jgi:hypothetical protein